MTALAAISPIVIALLVGIVIGLCLYPALTGE